MWRAGADVVRPTVRERMISGLAILRLHNWVVYGDSSRNVSPQLTFQSSGCRHRCRASANSSNSVTGNVRDFCYFACRPCASHAHGRSTTSAALMSICHRRACGIRNEWNEKKWKLREQEFPFCARRRRRRSPIRNLMINLVCFVCFLRFGAWMLCNDGALKVWKCLLIVGAFEGIF